MSKELREEILKKYAAIYLDDSVYTTKKDIELMMEEYKDLCHAQGSASGWVKIVEACRDELLKHMFNTSYTNGYPIKAVPQAIIISLTYIMKSYFEHENNVPPGEKEKDKSGLKFVDKDLQSRYDSIPAEAKLELYKQEIRELQEENKKLREKEKDSHAIKTEAGLEFFVWMLKKNYAVMNTMPPDYIGLHKRWLSELSPERSQENKECPDCKKAEKNRANGIKMVGPLAYDTPGKCEKHRQENKEADCLCLNCSPNKFPNLRFNVCGKCGNKRCPHATDHKFKCTNSNEPGQEGSIYHI